MDQEYLSSAAIKEIPQEPMFLVRMILFIVLRQRQRSNINGSMVSKLAIRNPIMELISPALILIARPHLWIRHILCQPSIIQSALLMPSKKEIQI